MNKNVIAVAILTIKKLSKDDITVLHLANHYRETGIYKSFYNDLSNDAKQMLYNYSQVELTLAFDIIFNVKGI